MERKHSRGREQGTNIPTDAMTDEPTIEHSGYVGHRQYLLDKENDLSPSNTTLFPHRQITANRGIEPTHYRMDENKLPARRGNLLATRKRVREDFRYFRS